jgi:hypothetical protein
MSLHFANMPLCPILPGAISIHIGGLDREIIPYITPITVHQFFYLVIMEDMWCSIILNEAHQYIWHFTVELHWVSHCESKII